MSLFNWDNNIRIRSAFCKSTPEIPDPKVPEIKTPSVDTPPSSSTGQGPTGPVKGTPQYEKWLQSYRQTVPEKPEDDINQWRIKKFSNEGLNPDPENSGFKTSASEYHVYAPGSDNAIESFPSERAAAHYVKANGGNILPSQKPAKLKNFDYFIKKMPMSLAGSYDPVGQHKNLSDLANMAQTALDLHNEGEPEYQLRASSKKAIEKWLSEINESMKPNSGTGI